ncbi:MAG: hypothetical protein U0324_06280 [Polyangiales bacterium]
MNAPPPTDDPLDAAWVALMERWDRDEGHRAFVGLAASLERLPDAARRYRALSSDPARAERAKQGVDRVLAAAMSAMKPASRERPRSVNVGLPLGVLAAAFLATMLAAKATGVGALTSPVVFVGEVIVVMLIPWRRLTSRGE